MADPAIRDASNRPPSKVVELRRLEPLGMNGVTCGNVESIGETTRNDIARPADTPNGVDAVNKPLASMSPVHRGPLRSKSGVAEAKSVMLLEVVREVEGVQ
jgi:hypothetical protein